jgi:hypothetical protein
MKSLLSILFVALLAFPALAVDSMGISGSTDTLEDILFVDPGTPFNMYVVLIDPSSVTIGGYECGLSFQGGTPFVLSVTGPNGWTNFGDNLNHLCGYGTPLPAAELTVLSTLNVLVSAAPFEALVIMGPSDPSSFGGEGPGYADGVNPEILVLCSVPADGVVGTITTEVVATEAHSLSSVKALFD